MTNPDLTAIAKDQKPTWPLTHYKNTPAILLSRYTPVPESGCWIWDGGTNTTGYGILVVENKRMVAHRYFYEQLKGPIPEGLTLDHLCRVRCCVNPNHLEAVSHRVNCLRGVGVSAFCAVKTHCIRNHPLSGDNVRIRLGDGGRDCKACHALRQRERRQRFNGH